MSVGRVAGADEAKPISMLTVASAFESSPPDLKATLFEVAFSFYSLQFYLFVNR
jgi:hypothetical protein